MKKHRKSIEKSLKSIEQAATFWSRFRARHEPNDHKLVKKIALWRLDVPCPPCLWRGVTDDLVKSRSEHAAVRLTTQCVPCGAQTRFQKGSGTVSETCAQRGSPRAPGVSGHARRAVRHAPPVSVGTRPRENHCKTQYFQPVRGHAHGHAHWFGSRPRARHEPNDHKLVK